MVPVVTERAVSDAVHDPVRLAALRHTTLLDTPPVESFDRLTRLAARALGAPVALLSLVDEERQFFKSFVGLPEPWASQRETPLSHSFCQHVVASGEPLLVADAREHPELHPDLAIAELGIVAYAGVPLRTREGQVLGTLCVTDSRPREWTEEDVETLRDLGATVVAEIEQSVADHESRAVRQWTGSILDGLPDGFATLDREWRFTYVNPRAAQILARSRDELLGHSIWAIFPDAVDTTFYREYHRAATEQAPVHFTEFYPPLNLWVDVHVYPSPEGISLYFRDTTERVQAEEALKQALERYELVGRATHDTIWEQDLVTGEGSWNEGIRTMFGYSPEEVQSAYSWWAERIHPEDLDRIRQTMQEVITGGGDYWSGEYRFRRADGSYATVLDRAYVARYEGKPLRIVGSMLDITERKRAEEALRRRAVQLRGLAHAALEINSTLAIERLLQSITERARDLIGAHQAVASLTVNQSWAQSINAVSLSEKYASWCSFDIPPDGSGIYSVVCETNRPMRLTQEELEAHPRWRAVGEVVGAHSPLRGWLAAPLIGRDGRNLGVIQLSDRYEGEFTAEDEAILVQLAQLASVTIENSQLIEEAHAASRAKSEFISAMSHEFRTPLSAIVGYGELLELELAGPLNEKQREQIGRIQISAWHLTELIEDILTFSRMEAGREELRVERVAVASIVAAATAMVEPVAEKKGLVFRMCLPEEPLALQTDPGKVRQILVNLLGNAVKFTDRGEVCLEARADGEAVVFEVHDTGIGIAGDQLERIFDPFWQVDQSATRQAGGTGLGLTVTRSLARLLGGEIGVESTLGKGSTFRLRLPGEAGVAAPR